MRLFTDPDLPPSPCSPVPIRLPSSPQPRIFKPHLGSGYHPPHYTIDEFSVEDAQLLMNLNFFSMFALCKLALPHIRKVRDSGIQPWWLMPHRARLTIYPSRLGQGQHHQHVVAGRHPRAAARHHLLRDQGSVGTHS
jgi:NAD(P)-dependent dehydrogenase (short-subunit alcohol dehydrogenase family)